VPDTLDEPHRVARQFERYTERHEVSQTQLPRAVRLVHAIAAEAERRRWRITTPPRTDGNRRRLRWNPGSDGHLTITAHNREFRLRIKEDGVPARGRHEEEQERARRWADWSWAPRRPVPDGPYDARATGRLQVHLDGGTPYGNRRRRTTWTDRPGHRVEDALPALFAEITARIQETALAEEHARLAAEARARAAEREAKERAERWRELVAEARDLYIEHHRINDLKDKLARRQTAASLREFLLECQQAHGHDAGTQEWLAWADAYLQRLDPLGTPPCLPTVPEPSREDLRPFMPPGWNPYHP
jgi:hypothetical protein